MLGLRFGAYCRETMPAACRVFWSIRDCATRLGHAFLKVEAEKAAIEARPLGAAPCLHGNPGSTVGVARPPEVRLHVPCLTPSPRQKATITTAEPSGANRLKANAARAALELRRLSTGTILALRKVTARRRLHRVRLRGPQPLLQMGRPPHGGRRLGSVVTACYRKDMSRITC